MSVSSDDIELVMVLLDMISDNLGLVVERYPSLAPEWLEWKPMEYWSIIKKDSFQKARDFLMYAVAQQDERVFAALQNHGLTGILLKSKVTFLDSVTKKVHGWLKQVPKTIDKSVVRKILSWLLDSLDDVLDSLAVVLPPLGAAQEFKKGMKTGLDAPTVLTREGG
jgi:hypothetical protein